MKVLRLIAIVGILACLGLIGPKDAPLVYCNGWVFCGNGPRMYLYPIDSCSYPMMEFRVGTDDLNAANYTDVLIPEGWQFAVEEVGMNHACGLHAPYGELSAGPCYSLTLGSAHWWTDDPAYAVEFFTFGYDHPWPPEDTAWELITRREGPPPEYYVFHEFWDAPVATGMGPVHGPTWMHEDCWLDEHCLPEHYCFYIDCDLETGWCMPLPAGCPDLDEPVCGCDGITYDNACYAAMMGMSVDHAGPCACPGDINGDRVVNSADLLILLGNWGGSGEGDIDENGVVNTADLLLLLGCWGQCP